MSNTPRRQGAMRYEALTAQVDGDAVTAPCSEEQRRRARLQVASYAGRTGLGMDQAAELLMMLGIHPSQSDREISGDTVPVASIHR